MQFRTLVLLVVRFQSSATITVGADCIRPRARATRPYEAFARRCRTILEAHYQILRLPMHAQCIDGSVFTSTSQDMSPLSVSFASLRIHQFARTICSFDYCLDQSDPDLAFFKLHQTIDSATGRCCHHIFQQSWMRVGFKHHSGGTVHCLRCRIDSSKI